ncbi:MAG: hypothetical protein Q8L14_23230 [Myxococcales bacterium]|nr:hypothetical protein [Myxococcales bacterium]
MKRLLVVASLGAVLGCAQQPAADTTDVASRTQGLAPANDRCTAPQALTANTPVLGTTVDANDDFTCHFLFGPDVVYSFTPTTTGAFRATATQLDAGPSDGGGFFCTNDGGCFQPFRPFVYLTDASCDGGQCRSTFRPGPVTFRASAGSTQFVVVDSYGGSVGGDFSLVVSSFVPTANDTCASPVPLTLGTTVAVDVSSAFDDAFGGSADAGSFCGVQGYDDVTFSFTPAVTGRYRFQSQGGLVSLSTGICGASCAPISSVVEANLNAGVTSFVIVDGYGSGPSTIRVDQLVVPANDTCANAQTVTLGVPVSGTTEGASIDLVCTTYTGPDVFFRFTPPSTGAYAAQASLVSQDGGFGFFTLGVAPGSCAADAGTTLCSERYAAQPYAFRATANVPVSLLVQTAFMSAPFQFVVNAITPPANDTCASPTALSAGVPVAVSLDDALDDLPANGTGGTLDGGFVGSCGDTGVADVVFSFTPSTTGRYRFQGPYSLSVGSGICGSSCFTRGFSALDVDLTAGATVFITVESSYPQSGTLRVDPIVVPANDRCVNGQTLTLGVPVSGTTAGASIDGLCLNSLDVFYRFTPAVTGTYSASVATADGGYVTIGVARNCGTDAGSPFDGGFDRCEVGSDRINFRGTASTPVNVVVMTSFSEASFQVQVNAITPPTNDTCSAPVALTVGTPVSVSFQNAFDDPFAEPDSGSPGALSDGGFLTGDGGFAVVDGGSSFSCGSGGYPDLVFSFTPSTTGRYEFQGPADLRLGSGTCGSSCFRYGYGSLIVDLTAGTTVWLVAEGGSWVSGVVRVDPLVIPTNDRCEQPLPVTAGVSVSGTTRGASDDFSCGFNGYGPDVVYSFTPNVSGVFRARAVGPSDGGFVGTSWRTASCDGGCLSSTGTVRTTSGTPSFVVVDTNYPGAAFQLTVNQVTPLPNDTCASPVALVLNTPVTTIIANAIDDFPGAGGSGDGGFGCGFAGYTDVVFSFTAPTTDDYLVVADNAAIVSSTACVGSCSYPSYGSTFVTLSAGETRYFIIEGFAETATITVSRYVPFDGGVRFDGGFASDAGVPPLVDAGVTVDGGARDGGAGGGAAGGGSAGGTATAGGSAAGGSAGGTATAGGSAAGGSAGGTATAGGSAAGGSAGGTATAGGSAGGTATAGGSAAGGSAGGTAGGGSMGGTGCGCTTTDPATMFSFMLLALGVLSKRRR